MTDRAGDALARFSEMLAGFRGKESEYESGRAFRPGGGKQQLQTVYFERPRRRGTMGEYPGIAHRGAAIQRPDAAGEPGRFSGKRGAGLRRRRLRRGAGPGDADYAASGQGTGVPGGFHRGGGGKITAAHAVDGRPRPAGRGAPAFLRGDYAGQAAAVYPACLPPHLYGAEHGQSAVAFSGGYPQTPDHHTGLAGRSSR